MDVEEFFPAFIQSASAPGKRERFGSVGTDYSVLASQGASVLWAENQTLSLRSPALAFRHFLSRCHRFRTKCNKAVSDCWLGRRQF